MDRASLSVEQVRQCLDYNPETGSLRWKQRPALGKAWNTRYAGKEAGSPDAYGYVQIYIHDVMFKAHRLAWMITTGAWPAHQIDHVNRDRKDNRLCNLRPVSQSLNQANSKRPTHNTSGLKGASFDKRRGHWTATIQVNGKQFYLGKHSTAALAHEAYIQAAKKHFGDFMHSGKEEQASGLDDPSDRPE